MTIVSVLIKHGVAFRYEAPLRLGFSTVYPDFTLRHPVTGEIVIWEHLGMMDDPEYRAGAIKKIQNYIAHGYYPGINLILTSETEDCPFDYAAAEQAVRCWLG